MKHPLLATAALLTLSACQTGTDGAMPATTRGDAMNDAAMTVVNGTRSACAFAPNVNSILAIMQGGEDARTQAMIQGICDEVRQIPNVETGMGPREVAVTYEGAVVEGVLSPEA